MCGSVSILHFMSRLLATLGTLSEKKTGICGGKIQKGEGRSPPFPLLDVIYQVIFGMPF